MHWARRAMILIGSTVVVIIIWYLCKTVILVNSVERDYVSTLFVLTLVGDYVAEHGEWPKSWQDLEQVKRRDSWKWPESSRRIQQRVAIDFNVNINDLARQSVNEFHAIRPIEPNELFEDDNLRRGPIASLLEIVRQLCAEKKPECRSQSQEDGSRALKPRFRSEDARRDRQAADGSASQNRE